MTLQEFLTEHTPLIAVEVLPDDRLINVVTDNGALHGVHVDNIPSNTTVTRIEATITDTQITTSTGLTFDATEYIMLFSNHDE
jgi:hypothetical protein